MTSNRTHGIYILGYYYKNMLQPNPYSREDFFAYYDRMYPGFIEDLGKTARSVSSDRIAKAMLNLFKSARGLPSPADIYEALALQASTLTSRDVGNAVSAGIKDAGKVVTAGAALYLIVPLIGLATVYLWKKK